MAETKRFLKQHGFTAKLVTTGTPGQEIQRMVIPVTPSTAQDFARRFSASKGFIRLREGYRDQGSFLFLSLTHDKLIHHRDVEQWNESTLFDPLKVVSHYRASSRLLLENQAAKAFYEGNPASFAVPVHLTPSKMNRLKSWVNNFVNNRQRVENWSNCMHLTTNAPLTDKLGLFGYLGIKRSKDGPNIIAKVMHASNKNICVVARYVQDQAELNNIPEGRSARAAALWRYRRGSGQRGGAVARPLLILPPPRVQWNIIKRHR